MGSLIRAGSEDNGNCGSQVDSLGFLGFRVLGFKVKGFRVLGF